MHIIRAPSQLFVNQVNRNNIKMVICIFWVLAKKIKANTTLISVAQANTIFAWLYVILNNNLVQNVLNADNKSTYLKSAYSMQPNIVITMDSMDRVNK